jgi:hypothetical protein
VKRTGDPGFRPIWRLGWLHLEWLGSWDSPRYSLFGAWRSGKGLTLRFRGWLFGVWPR